LFKKRKNHSPNLERSKEYLELLIIRFRIFGNNFVKEKMRKLIETLDIARRQILTLYC